MFHTVQPNINDLLIFIDFEKAFDSISWKFINKVFSYHNFGKDIIKWINLFYNDIKASILQCGVLADIFILQRGCNRGNPIASYITMC